MSIDLCVCMRACVCVCEGGGRVTLLVSCVSIMKLCTCFSALVSSSFRATTATTSAVQPAPWNRQRERREGGRDEERESEQGIKKVKQGRTDTESTE